MQSSSNIIYSLKPISFERSSDFRKSINPGRFAPRVEFILDGDKKNITKEKLQKLNQNIKGELTLVDHFVASYPDEEEKNSIDDEKQLFSASEEDSFSNEAKKQVSLYALENEFKTLCELHGNIETCSWIKTDEERSNIKTRRASLSEEDKITIEEYKLAIIQAVQRHYHQHGAHEAPKTKSEQLPPATKSSIALYVFLSITQACLMAIGGFLGMIELTTVFFPTISTIGLYLISGALTAIECIISYSIHAPYLRKGLGIPDPEMKRIITTIYDEQLQATLDINHALETERRFINKMDHIEYENNTRLAILFNEHIGNVIVEEYKESLGNKLTRHLFSGVNFFLNASSGYYMVSSALKTIAPALLGTAMGWSVIIIGIALFLVISTVTRSQSTYEMMNPDVPEIKSTNEKISLFEKSNANFKRALATKAISSGNKSERDRARDESHNFRYYRETRFKAVSPSNPELRAVDNSAALSS